MITCNVTAPKSTHAFGDGIGIGGGRFTSLFRRHALGLSWHLGEMRAISAHSAIIASVHSGAACMHASISALQPAPALSFIFIARLEEESLAALCIGPRASTNGVITALSHRWPAEGRRERSGRCDLYGRRAIAISPRRALTAVGSSNRRLYRKLLLCPPQAISLLTCGLSLGRRRLMRWTRPRT
jgi:hypothetical protein